MVEATTFAFGIWRERNSQKWINMRETGYYWVRLSYMDTPMIMTYDHTGWHTKYVDYTIDEFDFVADDPIIPPDMPAREQQ